MRVGINTLFMVPGDVGGSEVYLRQNLKYMIPNNQDIFFTVFTSHDNESTLKDDLTDFSNLIFVKLPLRSSIRPLRILFEQTMLPYFVWKERIDVLWSPGYTALLWCSCPQAVTVHDLQYKTHPEDLSLFERIVLNFLVKHSCKKCAAVITVSEFSKSEIKRFHFAPNDKIISVHEGVDPLFSRRVRPEGESKADLHFASPYILCVANTYPHKNVQVLVEAFGRISNKMPHHLVLIGTPRRGEKKVQSSINALNEKHKVHRIHHVNFTDLMLFYKRADLFVLPSEYEGFGLPILEAMLAGIPVITMDKAALPEVGGPHAIYVRESNSETLSQAIMACLEMEKGAQLKRIQQAKKWALAFTWEKSASETLDILKRLVIDS